MPVLTVFLYRSINIFFEFYLFFCINLKGVFKIKNCCLRRHLKIPRMTFEKRKRGGEMNFKEACKINKDRLDSGLISEKEYCVAQTILNRIQLTCHYRFKSGRFLSLMSN